MKYSDRASQNKQYETSFVKIRSFSPEICSVKDRKMTNFFGPFILLITTKIFVI